MEGSVINAGQPGVARHPATQLGEPRSRYSYQPAPQRYKTYSGRSERLAKGLGWFSISLGLAQLLAPRAMSRAAGIPDRPLLMRACGAREIACGVGILTRRRPTPWLWTRVAGDAIDLTILGISASKPDVQKNRVAAATVAVAGVTVLDVLTSVQQSDLDGARNVRELAGSLAQRISAVSVPGVVNVVQAITVNRPPIECYRFWHDFENFPRFMKHVEQVKRVSDTRWHWRAKGPAGTSFEWDSEITADQPGQRIAWRSIEGSEVENSGEVRFEPAPGGRGTIVRVEMQYSPPGGKAGALLAKLFGEEPSQQIEEDLRRFKQLIETGEIPTTVGQPSGRRDPLTRLLFRKGKPG